MVQPGSSRPCSISFTKRRPTLGYGGQPLASEGPLCILFPCRGMLVQLLEGSLHSIQLFLDSFAKSCMEARLHIKSCTLPILCL
uniref:Uncharacterized protein n=1 Tax=Cannabis sativa TaxID=3483 RepID=A0A803PIV1_CANSA